MKKEKTQWLNTEKKKKKKEKICKNRRKAKEGEKTK